MIITIRSILILILAVTVIFIYYGIAELTAIITEKIDTEHENTQKKMTSQYYSECASTFDHDLLHASRSLVLL